MFPGAATRERCIQKTGNTMNTRTFLLSPGLLALTCLLALLTWLTQPAQTVITLMAEGGPIENATVAAYAIAIAGLWLLRSSDVLTRLASSWVLLMFAAREMDLHKTLFGMSMLKSRFYLAGAALPRIEALAILLPLAIAVLYLLRKHTTALWQQLRQRQAVAVSIGCFLLALFVSKAIDRSLNMVFEISGVTSPVWLQALQLSLEETLELLLPVLALVAGWQSSPLYRAHLKA
jgi:hypothetical protein